MLSTERVGGREAYVFSEQLCVRAEGGVDVGDVADDVARRPLGRVAARPVRPAPVSQRLRRRTRCNRPTAERASLTDAAVYVYANTLSVLYTKWKHSGSTENVNFSRSNNVQT